MLKIADACLTRFRKHNTFKSKIFSKIRILIHVSMTQHSAIQQPWHNCNITVAGCSDPTRVFSKLDMAAKGDFEHEQGTHIHVVSNQLKVPQITNLTLQIFAMHLWKAISYPFTCLWCQLSFVAIRLVMSGCTNFYVWDESLIKGHWVITSQQSA